jgi:hypothetical protein
MTRLAQIGFLFAALVINTSCSHRWKDTPDTGSAWTVQWWRRRHTCLIGFTERRMACRDFGYQRSPVVARGPRRGRPAELALHGHWLSRRGGREIFRLEEFRPAVHFDPQLELADSRRDSHHVTQLGQAHGCGDRRWPRVSTHERQRLRILSHAERTGSVPPIAKSQPFSIRC